MNTSSEQVGASTPETYTISGEALTLLRACSEMSGKDLEDVVIEWSRAAFEAEVEDAAIRGDSEAVLIGAEADPALSVGIVNPKTLQIVPLTLDEARRLLVAAPTTALRTFRPRTKEGA